MNFTFENNKTNTGIEFFLDHINEYFLYVCLNIFGIVVGVFGNMLVFFSYWSTKELRDNTNLIIVNLAVADFILSSTNDSFAIAGKLNYIMCTNMFLKAYSKMSCLLLS